MRAFRPDHTKKSIISGRLAIDQTKLDFNFDVKGAEFLARITKIQNEKKAATTTRPKIEIKLVGSILNFFKF